MERLSCRLSFQLPVAHILLRHSGNCLSWRCMCACTCTPDGPPSYSARTSTKFTGWAPFFRHWPHLHGGSQYLEGLASIGHSSTISFLFFFLIVSIRRGEAVLCFLSCSITARQAPSRSNCHAMPCANNAQPAPGTAIAVLVLGAASIVWCSEIGCLASSSVVFYQAGLLGL
ncbi:hypothetical protein HDV57DRAFT_457318 [Trichoderma longibrachiatum]|uniref:Uncharacterized protein n=1 Tax=Trichoderma longibrachiatum ATCC 18648 TaxID=983965 RepID=A0A2T4C520_TRILO|nr:hypothetical protein M440DRAFT_1231526 [Trichoderma longibrachiatum ATCC 18648]